MKNFILLILLVLLIPVQGNTQLGTGKARLIILADMGIRFSQGYSSAPKCAPARAGLLTGQIPARVRYTENGNGRNQENFSKGLNGTVICENGNDNLPGDAHTIGEWFKQNAPHYTTAHFGKWHVGRPGNGPSDRGFDVSDSPIGNPDYTGPNPYLPVDPVDITETLFQKID